MKLRIGLIHIPGLVYEECFFFFFFARKRDSCGGKLKKYYSTQVEKYGESQASHLSLQCLMVKSWLNILAVPMGAPTALKNNKKKTSEISRAQWINASHFSNGQLKEDSCTWNE